MPIRSLCLSLFLCATAVSLPAEEIIDLEQLPGRAIYEKLCSECHGVMGEGVEGHCDDPLMGSKSVEWLAGRIERTMPEDKEDLCVGEDARKVADYVYLAFYSEAAQARNHSIKRDFTRLTVPQFQNSVADLVSTFRKGYQNNVPKERGLKGHYYASGRFRTDKKKEGKDRFDQIDGWLQFDYGDKPPKTPNGKEFNGEEFAIRWEGGIIARETGTYEFAIKTRNGVFLLVNERDSDSTKTIDGWVTPNNEIREEKGSVFLLGGRIYPIRVDYFKYKEDKAYFELLWKPPYGVWETIPARVLSPNYYHETMVVETPFPADDRSYGYERGSSVSRQWFDAVTSSAGEVTEYVMENLNELSGSKKDDPKRDEKLRQFALRFAEKAFRRPLSETEKAEFVDVHFRDAESTEQGLRRLILFTVCSPQFLYPQSAFESMDDPWAKAAEMALALWDSLPDDELVKRTREGKLNDPKKLEEVSRKMVWDWRTRSKMQGFFHHWLELDRAREVSKDDKKFPDFKPEVMSDLRTSLDLFVDEVMWASNFDYRQLLLADYLYLNTRLSKIYGDGSEKKGFEKVSLPPQNRSGVITHPYLLSAFAYHDNTSPIHRGVFLTRNIVGMALKPPPEAIEFKDSDFDPTLTMREKVTELTRSKACMACHSMINPLGFSLETFDAMGRFRVEESGKKINDDSEFRSDDGTNIRIKGPRDVAEFAANSRSAHHAFVRHLFHHCVKQPSAAYGPTTLKGLREHFANSNFNVPELLVQIGVKATQPREP